MAMSNYYDVLPNKLEKEALAAFIYRCYSLSKCHDN